LDPEILARRRWRQVERAAGKRDELGRRLQEARARAAELTSAQPGAEQRDREARGLSLVDGKSPPPSEAEKIARQLEGAQQDVQDFDAALGVANRRLQEVLDTNRHAWAQEQERTIEQARTEVLSALASLEQGIATLEGERALLAWLEPAPAEGSVDPHGGRHTHSGFLAAALDQVRAAVAGIAAGEESRQPDPAPEPSWLEKRLVGKAKPGWGG
jgi:hypothetical protein